MTPGTHSYTFAPGLSLNIRGSPAVLRHFAVEYGPAAARAATPAAVRVVFDSGPVNSRNYSRTVYKTVSWAAALSRPDCRPLEAAIRIRGFPRSFALSLVQGYYVEPLLAVAAASLGFVLLPAAAITENRRAVLVLGRSGSGKTSVSVRALVNGRQILGDDQILVDAAGLCRPFPRRMRLYSDLRETASGAYRRLPLSARAALRGWALVKTATSGRIAPPVRVARSALSATDRPQQLPLARILIVRRSIGQSAELVDADHRAAVHEARILIDEQRSRLHAAGDEEWRRALGDAASRDTALLAEAFQGVPTRVLSVPQSWAAPRAIAALAGALELDNGR
jgi:hypothetical protein